MRDNLHKQGRDNQRPGLLPPMLEERRNGALDHGMTIVSVDLLKEKLKRLQELRMQSANGMDAQAALIDDLRDQIATLEASQHKESG